MYSCFAVLHCIILCGWRPQIIISVVSGLKYLYFQKFSLKHKRLRGIIIISIYYLVALVL